MVTESSDCTRVFGALRHTALLLTFVDAVRLDITESNFFTSGTGIRVLFGAIHIDVPDWKPEDWGYVSVRARAQSGHLPL